MTLLKGASERRAKNLYNYNTKWQEIYFLVISQSNENYGHKDLSLEGPYDKNIKIHTLTRSLR